MQVTARPKLVVSADGTWGTYLFDARTGQAMRAIDEYTGGVQFSLDGRWVVRQLSLDIEAASNR